MLAFQTHSSLFFKLYLSCTRHYMATKHGLGPNCPIDIKPYAFSNGLLKWKPTQFQNSLSQDINFVSHMLVAKSTISVISLKILSFAFIEFKLHSLLSIEWPMCISSIPDLLHHYVMTQKPSGDKLSPFGIFNLGFSICDMGSIKSFPVCWQKTYYVGNRS